MALGLKTAHIAYHSATLRNLDVELDVVNAELVLQTQFDFS